MKNRRGEPQDDLISDMVQAQANGGEFDDEELRINLQALLVGGNLTTTDLIGNGVWLFLTHPEQLEAFKADPKLDQLAVEEVLRFEAPVQATSRIVPDERVVAGCPMHKSQPVFMSLAQPRSGEVRESGCVRRTGSASHVSLAAAQHCIGAPLAHRVPRALVRALSAHDPARAGTGMAHLARRVWAPAAVRPGGVARARPPALP